MATRTTIYSIMMTAVTYTISFVGYVCNAVYDTFILPCVDYVKEFLSSIEKGNFAKNYLGAKVSNYSSSFKAWMYDMFSRWRVDPQYSIQ